MEFGIDTLIIFLAFILPGFLTSRLIAVRTPALGRQPSPFEETSESLLRSVYIHLIISPVIFVTLRYYLVRVNPDTLQRIFNDGLLLYVNGRPFLVVLVLFIWLIMAFGLAFIFGYIWDPLDYVGSRLVDKIGTVTEDPYYQLRQTVSSKRAEGDEFVQLWMQARLKNGYTYRGELAFVSFKKDGNGRELMLANVKFFPFSVQTSDVACIEQKNYDFVFLDTANCESIEVMISNIAPSENENQTDATPR